jgi:hypothetical protein
MVIQPIRPRFVPRSFQVLRSRLPRVAFWHTPAPSMCSRRRAPKIERRATDADEC